MYYYKVLDNNGNVAYLLTYDQKPRSAEWPYVEITAEEHAILATGFVKKDELAGQLYRGEVAIDDVPEAWREEIQSRVDGMIKRYGEYTPEPTESELAVDEALAILHGETIE